MRVFENRVLRRVFGPKRDEVTREWRKLHSKEPYICTRHQTLFGWSNQEDGTGGSCSTYGRHESCI